MKRATKIKTKAIDIKQLMFSYMLTKLNLFSKFAQISDLEYHSMINSFNSNMSEISYNIIKIERKAKQIQKITEILIEIANIYKEKEGSLSNETKNNYLTLIQDNKKLVDRKDERSLLKEKKYYELRMKKRMNQRKEKIDQIKKEKDERRATHINHVLRSRNLVSKKIVSCINLWMVEDSNLLKSKKELYYGSIAKIIHENIKRSKKNIKGSKSVFKVLKTKEIIFYNTIFSIFDPKKEIREL